MILGGAKLLGRHKVQRLYGTLKSQPFELKRFYGDAIAVIGIDARYDRARLFVPATRPLVFVPNHPVEVMDGTILCRITAQ